MTPDVHGLVVDLKKAQRNLLVCDIVNTIARFYILVIFVPNGDVGETPLATWQARLGYYRQRKDLV
jgi:hypothetical protein